MKKVLAGIALLGLSFGVSAFEVGQDVSNQAVVVCKAPITLLDMYLSYQDKGVEEGNLHVIQAIKDPSVCKMVKGKIKVTKKIKEYDGFYYVKVDDADTDAISLIVSDVSFINNVIGKGK